MTDIMPQCIMDVHIFLTNLRDPRNFLFFNKILNDLFVSLTFESGCFRETTTNVSKKLAQGRILKKHFQRTVFQRSFVSWPVIVSLEVLVEK